MVCCSHSFVIDRSYYRTHFHWHQCFYSQTCYFPSDLYSPNEPYSFLVSVSVVSLVSLSKQCYSTVFAYTNEPCSTRSLSHCPQSSLPSLHSILTHVRCNG